MDAVVLGLRVLLSLTVVLGLLWYLHRKVSRYNRTGNKADPVTVVTRQGISPKASVVMIEAEGKRFLLGVTDQSVNVLHTSTAPGLVSVPPLADSDTGDDGRTHRSDRQTGESTDVGGATFARVLSLATASTDTGTDRAARRRAGTHPIAETVPPGQGPTTRADLKRSGRRAARPVAAHTSTPRPASPLAGSILSPDTWKQTAAALRQGRTG
ncbi:flagellar biosynthetic protein FliO [Arthrobacter sp. 260]|uniref:FliO/MopB family protein n=1 Tax=Arthrobacter sp. 260 TaxID=2735314 RepID=UPI0014910D7A|nr:flagellar biosynthetic protein FliO [Arthrobacter sp. 260]NOJ60479.1 FliO/MopB family protein [Arthrobacter sp. 260]